MSAQKQLLNRLEWAHSRQCWDNLTTLVDKEFKGLEGWMANNANPKTIKLARWLADGLSDNEARWEAESQLEIIATLTKTGQRKLDYIEELLGKLQTQVLGAPLAESDKDEDTSEARL